MIFFRAVQGIGMVVYSMLDSVASVVFPCKPVLLIVGVISTNNPIGTTIGLLGCSALLDAFPVAEHVIVDAFSP